MTLACLLWDLAKLCTFASAKLDRLGDKAANHFVERHVHGR